jgi:hypothetical protein
VGTAQPHIGDLESGKHGGSLEIMAHRESSARQSRPSRPG